MSAWYAFYINRHSPTPTRVPLGSSWKTCLVVIGLDVSSVAINITDWDSTTRVKNKTLRSIQPRTSKHKASRLHQSLAPLNSLFEEKRGEKSILVAA